MSKRRWRFIAFALCLAPLVYSSEPVQAESTALEKRLLDCATGCSSAEDRYTAIVLLSHMRPSPNSLEQRERIAEASTDPVMKVLASYSLYRSESHSRKRANAFVASLQDEAVRERLWSVATTDTHYFGIVDFWSGLTDIAVYDADERALEALFEMASESDAGEAEYVTSSIVSVLVRKPEQTIQMMEAIGADKSVLKLALTSQLVDSDAASLEQALVNSPLDSPFRDLIMEHLGGR